MAQSTFVNRYTRSDRLLHRLAFSSRGLQVSLADVEDRMYAQQLSGISVDRPVFITALPRAGTTIVLNLVYETREFVSHTYESMPFVLCPMIWHRFARMFRSSGNQEMERAHADGLKISMHSAEAFEEMIWHYFWRQQYESDRIEPWTRRRNSEFLAFFNNHVRKLVCLAGGGENLRYLSKNNLNVSRLEYLASVFPDACIIVPFRAPFEHAASLHRQHLGFLQAHAEDPFSKTYMRGIGHFDFGENLLPVNFDNWLSGDRRADATELQFWVEYWIAGYRNLISRSSTSIHLFPFDRWTRRPKAGLEWLAEKIELKNPEALIKQAGAVRELPRHATSCPQIPEPLAEEAIRLFDELNDKASFT